MADDVLPSDGADVKTARCETCRYSAFAFHLLVCRKYAPRPAAESNPSAHWPTVYRDDWCGEYAPGVRGGPRG